MELKNQVIDLAQAKRLAELGVKAPSLFNWIEQAQANYAEIHYGTTYSLYIDDEEYVLWDEYPAYSVAELGMMLSKVEYEAYGFPMVFTSYSHNDDGLTAEALGKWHCMFRNPKNFNNPNIKSDTEAQARGAMLIYLLENNYITPEQINEIC